MGTQESQRHLPSHLPPRPHFQKGAGEGGRCWGMTTSHLLLSGSPAGQPHLPHARSQSTRNHYIAARQAQPWPGSLSPAHPVAQVSGCSPSSGEGANHSEKPGTFAQKSGLGPWERRLGPTGVPRAEKAAGGHLSRSQGCGTPAARAGTSLGPTGSSEGAERLTWVGVGRKTDPWPVDGPPGPQHSQGLGDWKGLSS